MGLLSWIVIGLLAGWIGGIVTGRRGQGCITTIAIGVLGAFIGGALATAAGYEGIDEFSLRSVLVAGLGSALLLFVLNALGGKKR
ncbi:MAG: GlsB/YeaQ/YmgE family stress response membrane protein [Acidimicrobiales bacterium]